MRLICPNCGAQYAVADDVIPAGGRDVQCSNCAHTWFETPGASASDTPPPPRKPRPATPPPPAAERPASRFDGPISKAFEDDIDDDDDAVPAPPPTTGRKTVDPDVADILRQEAARETEQRKKETPAPPPETPSESGLARPHTETEAPAPQPETPAQTAAASIGALVAPASNGNRRELLPDIEEINSSLKPDTDRGDITHAGVRAAANKQRRNFRSGFFMMLLVIAILALIYTQSDAIKAAVPALSGLLDGYVGAVDSGRVWIDQNIRSMLTSVSADS